MFSTMHTHFQYTSPDVHFCKKHIVANMYLHLKTYLVQHLVKEISFASHAFQLELPRAFNLEN